MISFYERLLSYMEGLDPPLNYYRLQFLSSIGSGQFSLWKAGKRKPSLNDLKKLSEVPELGLSYATLEAWRLLDEASPEAIRLACQLVESCP